MTFPAGETYRGPLEDVPMFRYGGIIADPPWDFSLYSEKGQGKAPQAHYSCMALEDIKALRVGDRAAGDCVLMLWATWPMLREAFDVMAAWGFRYITGGAWAKRTKHGKRGFGTGYVLRSASEPFLIGAVGSPAWASRAERNVLEPPEDQSENLMEAERRDHSRKPDAQYGIVERLQPNARYLELFARAERPGWDSWGDQVGLFAEAGA